MHIFKKIGKLITFFLILNILIEGVDQLVMVPTESRLMLHDLYSQEKNIDMLFLGASHTYEFYAPEIFDKEFGINSFNLGSSGQTPKATYYLLTET